MRIVMEVLAGGRDDTHVAQLLRLLARCEFVPVSRLGDYEQAAALYRRCWRTFLCSSSTVTSR